MNKRKSKTARASRPLRVLVDMDGVLCDFEGHFLKLFRKINPDDPFIPLEERNMFYVDLQYRNLREDLQEKCTSIIESEGFFRDLPPIEGAIDAVKEMSGLDGVEVFLCTSPLTSTPRSVSEKFEWVLSHMGRDWTSKTIITRDKTMVVGDLLIDDRPKIHGVVKPPTWDHILFTSCHNKHLDVSQLVCKHRLDNWTDDCWRTLVEQHKKQL